MKYHYVDDGIQEKIHFSATPGNVLSANGQKKIIWQSPLWCNSVFRFPIKYSNAIKDIK